MSRIQKIMAIGLTLLAAAPIGVMAARRSKDHRAQPAAPAAGRQSPTGNSASHPPVQPAAADAQSSGGEPVFELSADVHADEIRFDSRPQTHARLSGPPDRPGAEVIQTQNMPRDPEPGRTYQNVTIHIYFNSLLEQALSPLLGQQGSTTAPRTEPPSSLQRSGSTHSSAPQNVVASAASDTPAKPGTADAAGTTATPATSGDSSR